MYHFKGRSIHGKSFNEFDNRFSFSEKDKGW